AEVLDVGDVASLLGRRGEAEVDRRGEVLQYLAPGRVLGGAPAVALVDDDEVEEVRRELLVDVLLLLGPRDRLVEREVDLVALVDRPVRDFCPRVPERLEVVDPGLVGEGVAVREEEDAPDAAGLPASPDNLESAVGLPRAGRQYQEEPPL